MARPLNDVSESLVEGIGLGSFFDKHNLPPTIFPAIILLAAILVLAFFLSPLESSDSPHCGDSFCDPELGEDIISCPEDCRDNYQNLTDIRVDVIGEVESIIKITVTDSGGNLLKTDLGKISELLVARADAKQAIAKVTNPLNSKTISSGPIDLIENPTVIPLGLPPNFFEDGARGDQMKQLEDFGNSTPIGVYDTDGNLVQNLSNASSFYETPQEEPFLIKLEENGTEWASGVINDTNDSITMSPIVEDPLVLICSDGTPYGYCSLTPPKYCDNGTMVDKCSWCSCEEGWECMSNESCALPQDEAELPGCQGTRGDLDGSGEIDKRDQKKLDAILTEISSTGFSEDGWDDIGCTDVNGDGYLTNEDMECISKIIDGTYDFISECPSCVPDNESEICHDGKDNDCDGQVDRDTYDESDGEYYGFPSSPVDLCECNELTPCDMVWVINEFKGLSEDNVKYCSSISGLGGDYRWRKKDEWKCKPGREGWNLLCGDSSYECISTYDWYGWRHNTAFYKGYECFGKEASDSSGCRSSGSINCGGSACETGIPGYFDEVRGYVATGGEYWGDCKVMGPSGAADCECRCNRNKLYCGDHTANVDPQACWTPGGDRLCESEEEYGYC